jgi:hypothetical protein
MSRIFRVRTEGNRHSTDSPYTTLNIFVGFTFKEESPHKIYVHIGNHKRIADGEGVSGVFTASKRVDSTTSSYYTQNSTYQIASTGTDTCTVAEVTPHTAIAELADLSNNIHSGTSIDDDFFMLPIPWTVTFLGVDYPPGKVFLCTNTYLTFGTGINTITVTESTPPLPKLVIGNADNRMTNVKSDKFAAPLGVFNMTQKIGDGTTFTITQPTSLSSGAFTYSVTAGSGVISISGTTVTILNAGSATVEASQEASGVWAAGTKSATITIEGEIATLDTSQSIFYRKLVSGASISFNDVISSNAGAVPRTYESNNTSVVTIPTASTASASIAGPGKTTIKVTQPATGKYTQIVNNDLITIVVVGQGKTYTSETFPASFDLSETNLSDSIFNSCNLTGADLYNATVNAYTSFSTPTILNSLKSGRITGVTSLLPSGYIMI